MVMKKPQSIIERAEAPRLRERRTKHAELDLHILAKKWLQGTVTNVALAEALGRKPNAIAGSIATVMYALRRAVVLGNAIIKLKGQ